jgi:L-aminopeptidase/D-esterase-like protein
MTTTAEIEERLGVHIGHYESPQRPTGCTVCLYPNGATAGVSVVGAAPGTRETDLLNPSSTVSEVHAILLSGGSAYGLDAATGVMRWLNEHGHGLELGPVRVPIVPGAVLFDLWVDDFVKFPRGSGIHPDAEAGYLACEHAIKGKTSASGNFGAGYGATVGKLNGNDCAMRGGLGLSMMEVDGIAIAAVVACNAVGDIVDR